MGWETRRGQKYFYRLKHAGGKKRRHYIGAGVLGKVAAGFDAIEHAERTAWAAAEQEASQRLEEAQEALDTFWNRSALILNASLLAAGFHHPNRHRWRRWHAARRILRND